MMGSVLNDFSEMAHRDEGDQGDDNGNGWISQRPMKDTSLSSPFSL
jgi:hypothetical protein